jgi:hypothetical protein
MDDSPSPHPNCAMRDCEQLKTPTELEKTSDHGASSDSRASPSLCETNIHNQVHAEASTFASGITKEEAYAQVLEQAAALFDGQRNWVWFAQTKRHALRKRWELTFLRE